MENLQEPTIDSIKQITQNVQGEIAGLLGVNLLQLGRMAVYLNLDQLQRIFQQFVNNEVQDGVQNQHQARANAAARLRDTVRVLLNDILGQNNDVAMDGGRKRHRTRRSKKRNATRRK